MVIAYCVLSASVSIAPVPFAEFSLIAVTPVFADIGVVEYITFLRLSMKLDFP